jgi:hypothetical protein
MLNNVKGNNKINSLRIISEHQDPAVGLLTIQPGVATSNEGTKELQQTVENPEFPARERHKFRTPAR